MTNRDKIKCLCNIAENFGKAFDVEKLYGAYKEELSYTHVNKNSNSSIETRDSQLQEILTSEKNLPELIKYIQRYTDYKELNRYTLNQCSALVSSEERLHYWSNKKIVYSFTKEMADCLLSRESIKGAADIPVTAFTYLPHDSFFINLNQEENDISGIFKQHNSELLGLLVTKRRPLPGEKAEISFDTVYLNPTSHKKSHIDTKTLTFFTDQTNMSIEKAIFSQYDEDTKFLSKMIKSEKIAETAKEVLREKVERMLQMNLEMQQIITKYIPLVLYLAAEKAQIKEVSPAKEKRPLPNKGKLKNLSQKVEPKKFIVGEEFAINYRKYQAARSSSSKSSSDGTSYTMAPHARKAHWHHFWKGSDVNPEKNGPRRLVLQFVEETFIHKELKEMVRPTVISVDSSSKADSDITDISEEDEKDF